MHTARLLESQVIGVASENRGRLGSARSLADFTIEQPF